MSGHQRARASLQTGRLDQTTALLYFGWMRLAQQAGIPRENDLFLYCGWPEFE